MSRVLTKFLKNINFFHISTFLFILTSSIAATVAARHNITVTILDLKNRDPTNSINPTSLFKNVCRNPKLLNLCHAIIKELILIKAITKIHIQIIKPKSR